MINSLPFPSLTLLVLLLTTIPSTQASQGDKSAAYQRCLSTCLSTCSSPPPSSPFSSSSSTSIFKFTKISIWSCPSNCAYKCTNHLTNLALSYSPSTISLLSDTEISALIGDNSFGPLEGLELGEMVQFHGKWPFVRYLGMQELGSVLFSIGNFWGHWKGYKRLGRISTTMNGSRNGLGKIRERGGRGRSGAYRLRGLYKFNAVVGMNVWIWSSIFHTRDLPWSEKMDYFSATAAMLYGLYLVLIRFFCLYQPSRSHRYGRNEVLLGILSVGGIGILYYHCNYLISLPRFDYTYNMTFNLTIGLSSILLWVYFSFSHRSFLPHYLTPLPPLILLLSLSIFEIHDFPPFPKGLRLVDAHALWHAGTMAVVKLWYDFLERDLIWVSRSGGGGSGTEGSEEEWKDY